MVLSSSRLASEQLPRRYHAGYKRQRGIDKSRCFNDSIMREEELVCIEFKGVQEDWFDTVSVTPGEVGEGEAVKISKKRTLQATKLSNR